MAWGKAIEKIEEINRIACPEPAPADKAALAKRTPRPKHWREKGATKGELLAHVDRLELSHEAKAAAAARVLAEFERCRGAAPTS